MQIRYNNNSRGEITLSASSSFFLLLLGVNNANPHGYHDLYGFYTDSIELLLKCLSFGYLKITYTT